MAKRSTEEVALNMTPMIDIVFQLMIFFIVTADQDRKRFDERIHLAFSPNGPAIEKQDPRTVIIDVDEKGRITINRVRLSHDQLTAILRQAISQYGKSTPVHIRGDRKVRHDSVRQVMDACGKAGVWRVSFVATKEKAGKGG